MDDKGSIPNVDGPSVLKKELHVPRPDMEKVQDIAWSHYSSTYNASTERTWAICITAACISCIGAAKALDMKNCMERKFEIVLFAKNARMELKSSANESWEVDLHTAV
jgi:hypothetical protein